MQGIGANQTVDQVEFFGKKVRFATTIEAPGHEEDMDGEWRSTIDRVVRAAEGSLGRRGPVHLNIRFEEPTVPVTDDGRTRAQPYPHSIEGRPGHRVWLHEENPQVAPVTRLEVPPSSRGLIIAGDGVYDREAVRRNSDRLGWPIVATALSGMRGEEVVSTYHHALADGVPSFLCPQIVVAVGSVGPSSRVEDLIASARFRLRVDVSGRIIDPRRNATAVLHADPVEVLETLVAEPDASWGDKWLGLDADVRKVLQSYISGLASPSGAGIATAINDSRWDSLVVSSSLPIRDVDAHLTEGGAVIGNRGASGIDGFVSTALGVASVGDRTLAISGDLSLFHDSNGFHVDIRDDLVMVVVDNDGGGLFDLLPQAIHAPEYERLFVTPHGRNMEALAEHHGVAYLETEDMAAMKGLIGEAQDAGGVTLVRVPVERSHDLAVRHALDELGAGAARSGHQA